MITELFESTSTKIFTVVIFIIFVSAIVLDREGKRKTFIEYAPTLMTSLGMLGTFWGVVLGLLSFDSINIDTSIPKLLSGLKTAFVTSIIGMLASITFNALKAWRSTETRNKQEAEQENFYNSVVKQTELLNEIKSCLVNSESDSLAMQLTLLRTDLHNHRHAFDAVLWNKFDEFACKVTQSATEQIITALNSVVLDFNNKLTEQFGENFKALDTSVIKMIDWQQKYKEQLSLMDVQLKKSVESMTSASEAIAVISERCDKIPVTMSGLHSIIETNQNQLENLERHLEAFVLMRDQAIIAVPLLREEIQRIGSLMTTSSDNLQSVLEQSAQRLMTNLESMNTTMDNSIKKMGDSYHNGISALEKMENQLSVGNDKMFDAMNLGVQKIGNEILSHHEKLRAGMEQGVNQFNDGLLSINSQMQNTMENGYQEIKSTTENYISIFNEAIDAKRTAFEQVTEQEINRELEAMKNALQQITKGLVQNSEQLLNNSNLEMPKIEESLSSVEKVS